MFKKLLAMMLAVMTVFSLSSVAFAHENVDNTFDHFTPEPGVEAPDDWYDPYCYESDGRINKYCLNQGGEADDTAFVAMYCPEHKKIFTISRMGRIAATDNYHPLVHKTEKFYPYEVKCKDWTHCSNYDTGEIEILDTKTQWFCPYCGKYEMAYYTNEDEFRLNSAGETHIGVSPVVYGFQCDKCESFIVDTRFAQDIDELDPRQFNSHYNYIGCLHDDSRVDINTVKLYRFLTKKNREAEYSFIFKETEKDFGDGKDGRVEDLKEGKAGYYTWDSPDNPYAVAKEKTFFEKVADFFASIADFFKRIFTGIFNF